MIDQFLFMGSDGVLLSADACARRTALSVISSKALVGIASRATILFSILGGLVSTGRSSAKTSVSSPPDSPSPTHSVTNTVGSAGPSVTGGSCFVGCLAIPHSPFWMGQDGRIFEWEST